MSSISSGGDCNFDDLESSDKSSAIFSPRILRTKRNMKSGMTQQKKAGCPKKPAAGEGSQMPNYLEDEDYFIPKEFTNVTIDPMRGVLGQKGENIWTRFHIKYCILQQTELLVESGQHIPV